MSVSEKVAYLRGLMEGLDMDEDKKETKLFNAIIEALDDVASELSDIDEDMEELADYIEELDEDLGDVEEFVYDLDDDCDWASRVTQLQTPQNPLLLKQALKLRFLSSLTRAK